MKRLLPYLILFISISSIEHIHAQNSIGNLVIKNKYKGDHYFLGLYYEEAIKYYRLALKKDRNKNAIRLKIGDCYRLLNDFTRAAYWYQHGLEKDSTETLLQKPIYAYLYGNVLMSEEKYDEAKPWFELYQELVPEDHRPDRKLVGLDKFWDYFMDSTLVEIEGLEINTEFSELASVPYNNGIVFVSARPQSSLVDNDYLREVDLYDVYQATFDSSGWKKAESFDKIINTPYHEGPVSFYTGEDKMLFTRSNYFDKRQTKAANGKTNLQIYSATKTGDIWANIQPFSLNNPDYSLAHPALNQSNDTLFFASNMPGGFGGADLYMTTYSGQWSAPVNLGPIINTEGDELFPSYISERLFYSSDGHDGIGGLDIYKAAIKNGEIIYSVNMGTPLNSPYDDYAYNIEPATRSGYFTSNRYGGKGKDDLYSHIQTGQVIAGIALEEHDQTPLAGVQVNLIQNGLAIATILTGQDGSFRFQIPLDSDFDIVATKDEHSLDAEIHVSSRGSRVDIDSVYIKMYKHDFFARGLIYDNLTQSLMHDVRVIITPEGEEADTVRTGLNGLYSFVIRPGKNYWIKAEKDGFIPDSLQINSRLINKGIITNDFALEEKYIDKETIFFDYNKFDLRDDAIPALLKVVDVHKRDPDNWVIISAHADSRGKKEYNQELSEKRARAVVNYFISHGIDRDKIIARGFGEGLVINRCVDGVNCHEEDHSKNRRAEIAVEEKLPEEERENKGF